MAKDLERARVLAEALAKVLGMEKALVKVVEEAMVLALAEVPQMVDMEKVEELVLELGMVDMRLNTVHGEEDLGTDTALIAG